jgi:hypothetical protein
MSNFHLSRQRALPCNIRAFVLELEERFGCTFFSAAGGGFSALLAPSRTLIEVDPQRGILRLSSPLQAAGSDLNPDRGFAILIRNFPSEALCGAGIRESLEEDGLEIFRETALKMLSVAGIASFVSDHVRAAESFDQWLSSHRLLHPMRQAPTLEMADAAA